MASLHKGGINTRSMVTLPPLITSDEVVADEQDNLMQMTTATRKFNVVKALEERICSKPKDDSVEAMVQENPKFSKPGGIATRKIKAEEFI